MILTRIHHIVKVRHLKSLAHGFKPESELDFAPRESVLRPSLRCEVPLLKEAVSFGSWNTAGLVFGASQAVAARVF